MWLLRSGKGNFPYVDSNNYLGLPKRPRRSTAVWPAVAGSASMASPPRAPRRPHVISAHGHDREDPWFWLRERDDPEVLAYLEAENAYTDQEMAPLDALRDGLFEEMRARIKETDMSVPSRRGPWWYYTRTEEGQELRHPLPPPRPWPRRAPSGRRAGGRGADPARRERAGGGVRVLRRRQCGGQQRPPLAGLRHRPRREREVRPAVPAARCRDPAHRGRRVGARDRLRPGLVGRG